MKIYPFTCGTICTKRYLIEGGSVSDEPFEVPVPFFLIEHKQRLILFDVGYAYSTINSPSEGNYIPIMTEQDYVVNQLSSLGINKNDITHIVLSHLHADHADGLEAFKDIPCFLQRDELNMPEADDFVQKHSVIWKWLDGDHDLFGDGRVRILKTSGHSPGHQSLLLTKDSSEEVLLAADAAYTRLSLESKCLSSTTMESIKRIRELQNRGIHIIFGHDPDQWSNLEKADL